MHELALCQSLTRIVVRAAAGRRVASVSVDVGQLRQVVPESLHHCWGIVVAGTPLAGSVLEIRSLPVVLDCRACGVTTTVSDAPAFRCAACGSGDTRVVSGEEFRVVSIDVEQPSDADASVPPTAAGASGPQTTDASASVSLSQGAKASGKDA